MAHSRRSPTPRTVVAPESGYPSVPAAGSTDWRGLVERIRADDPGGMEELYGLFSRGVRFYLCRQLGLQELEEKVHDTFLIVVQAIRRGELREPERLMGFVRTVVRRQVVAYIDAAVHDRREQANLHCGLGVTDRRSDPEQDAIARQQTEIIEKVLRSIPRRDREILTRFYLLGQTQAQLCSEMGLTVVQFRLLKSRAKARLSELSRRKLSRRERTDRRSEVRVDQTGGAALDIDSLLPVLAHAVAVFGDEHKAAHWLSTPLALLADRSPREVLEGKGGVKLVDQVLTRIEHNIPS